MTAANLPTEQIARLTGHNAPINTLTYSSGNGQYLLSGSSDRTINLYNPSKPAFSALIQTYTGAHTHSILSVAVSSTNATFLSSGGDKFICIWDVSTARTLRKLGSGSAGGHGGRVEAVAYAGENESVVVSASYDASVRLWDVRAQGGRPMMVFAEARDSVDCLCVEGTEIWAGSVDGRVRGYDIRMGVVSTDVLGHPVTSITPTQDHSSHLISTLDSTIRLIDKPTGRLLQSYTSSTPAPNPSADLSSKFAPSGAVGIATQASMPSSTYQNTTYRIRSTLTCADAVVLAGSEDGSIWAWDVLTGDVAHRLWHAPRDDVHGRVGTTRKVVSAVAWRRKGGRGEGKWASAGADGTIVVWGHAEKT